MLNWSYKWYDPQGRLSIKEVAQEFTALALAGLAKNEQQLRRTSTGLRKRQTRPSVRVGVDRPDPRA